jgi:3-deoxy-D-manno-octulosonate cytidylyltransferase
MRCVIVIPARMGATRFPGKPLVDLMGKPMVQWVWEAAEKAGIADKVVVAAPDQEIMDAAHAFGAESVLTSHDHLTGTDRISEVAQKIPADVYVNVQGDEPLISPQSIADCAMPILQREDIQMASAYCPCPDSDLENPAAVKVVTDKEGWALYFSRYAIPFARNPRPIGVKKHLGLYAFRRDALLQFSRWPQSPLEISESLEQLRFLHNGVRIFMSETQPAELAVDTPEQAEEVRQILSARMKGN